MAKREWYCFLNGKHCLWIPSTSLLNIEACEVLHQYAAPKETNTSPYTQSRAENRGQEREMLLHTGLIKFFGLTWKDAVGWMLTLACFQRSPWLPLSDHTGPSEVVWPFCFRRAFNVPAWARETGTHRGQCTHINMITINVEKCTALLQAVEPWQANVHHCAEWRQDKLSKTIIRWFYMVLQCRLVLLNNSVCSPVFSTTTCWYLI